MILLTMVTCAKGKYKIFLIDRHSRCHFKHVLFAFKNIYQNHLLYSTRVENLSANDRCSSQHYFKTIKLVFFLTKLPLSSQIHMLIFRIWKWINDLWDFYWNIWFNITRSEWITMAYLLGALITNLCERTTQFDKIREFMTLIFIRYTINGGIHHKTDQCLLKLSCQICKQHKIVKL